MKTFSAIFFAALALLSVIVLVGGILVGAIFPWFGDIRAEHIGEIGFSLAMLGEGFVQIFGWLHACFSQGRKQPFMGLPAPKKYGNKKPMTWS